ncbi:MAG: hypothetical protein KDA80_09545, partial [Planctomycetaceae bacterium]|nr:hypothetical protein [Planctomycetaceae bacterium]
MTFDAPPQSADGRLAIQTPCRLATLGIACLLICGCPTPKDPTPRPESAEPTWQRETVSPEPSAVEITARLNGVGDLAHASPEERELAPEVIHRPDDDRPEHDYERLAKLGVQRYESPHFELLTDIDPAIAESLPPMVEQLFASFVDYFGELPPSRDGRVYQITGYLIGDMDRFAAAGLLPDDLPLFEHGRHRGQEFWMQDQEFDYYRRHLLFHEATHCYTMAMPGPYPPTWYLEGVAELFATHRGNESGQLTFRVMPDESSDFRGLGRIEMIQDEIAAGRLLTLAQVGQLGNRAFSESRSIPYAWSWALCKFLDTHPRYQDRFRELARHLEGNEFTRLLATTFEPDRELIAAEWLEFARRLRLGTDITADAFQVVETRTWDERKTSLEVAAKLGWQSTGLVLASGVDYHLSASGEVVLAQDPKPWRSEPQGITIRYAAGVPMGRLLAGVVPTSADGQKQFGSDFPVYAVGREGTLRLRAAGTLFLRVNDF